MRISDWSSDVCSSDLDDPQPGEVVRGDILRIGGGSNYQAKGQKGWGIQNDFTYTGIEGHTIKAGIKSKWVELRSEEHTSELQSLMRISYAVFCLKKKKGNIDRNTLINKNTTDKIIV